jgi:hypothetical protein
MELVVRQLEAGDYEKGDQTAKDAGERRAGG